MGQLFTAFLSLFTRLFSAAENAAIVAENITLWGAEASGQQVDIARANRQAALKELLEESGLTELPKPQARQAAVVTKAKIAKAKPEAEQA